MEYPSYLVHFNKNHSPKNGQFTFGDGDGDGTRNDHAHQKKGSFSPKAKTLNSEYKKSTKIKNVTERKDSLTKQLKDPDINDFPNLKKAVLKDLAAIDPEYRDQYLNYVEERQIKRGSNFIKGAIAGTLTGLGFKGAVTAHDLFK